MTTDRRVFVARVERESSEFYSVWIDDLETVGQSLVEDGYAGIGQAAREVISLWLDTPEDSFDVVIRMGEVFALWQKEADRG